MVSHSLRLLLFASVKPVMGSLATDQCRPVDNARHQSPTCEGHRCGGGRAVNWDEQLFELLDDLEHQAQALYDADRASELADRSRAEYVAVTLVSRLMASVDDDVTLDLTGVGQVAGRLGRVGPDWCLVHGPGQDWVVRLAAVACVEGASPRSVPEV